MDLGLCHWNLLDNLRLSFLKLYPKSMVALMKPLISMIMACLCLTGCGLIRSVEVSNMDETQIRTVSNKDLCRTLAISDVITQEVNRRNLGDCSKERATCADLGYVTGSNAYYQCIQNERNIEAAQSAAIAALYYQGMQSAGNAYGNAAQQNYQAVKPLNMTPQYTTCNQTGNSIQCFSQ